MHHSVTVLRGLARRVVQGDADALGRLKSLAHVRPVPHMPGCLEEIGLTILVLKVVSMFPGIEDHERDPRLRQIGLVVVDLSGQETAAHRFPYECGPRRSHDRLGSMSHMQLEGAYVVESRYCRLS